jgi:3,4-dihydroxy-2-butanone 4-phosphate synthase
MGSTQPNFATVEEVLEDIRQGRMIVLVDDEDRENEGDLAMAAEKISPEAINFMAKYGRGLICLPLTEQRCDELSLPLMSPINTSVHGTAFTEAIDARAGVTTGISASDRAITILRPGRRISPVPDISSRCAHATGACWFGLAKPKLPWTWRASPACIPQG